MISNDGSGYWATGISLHHTEDGWAGRLKFFDDGFRDDNPDAGRVATEGELRTRYQVADGNTVTGLRAVIDALTADARRLGITMRCCDGKPALYYDSDTDRFPPPAGWRALLGAEADRLGWEFPYPREDTNL